jgi:hypothetical protein
MLIRVKFNDNRQIRIKASEVATVAGVLIIKTQYKNRVAIQEFPMTTVDNFTFQTKPRTGRFNAIRHCRPELKKETT